MYCKLIDRKCCYYSKNNHHTHHREERPTEREPRCSRWQEMVACVCVCVRGKPGRGVLGLSFPNHAQWKQLLIALLKMMLTQHTAVDKPLQDATQTVKSTGVWIWCARSLGLPRRLVVSSKCHFNISIAISNCHKSLEKRIVTIDIGSFFYSNEEDWMDQNRACWTSYNFYLS